MINVMHELRELGSEVRDFSSATARFIADAMVPDALKARTYRNRRDTALNLSSDALSLVTTVGVGVITGGNPLSIAAAWGASRLVVAANQADVVNG